MHSTPNFSEREGRSSHHRIKGDGKSWKHHGHQHQRHGYVAEGTAGDEWTEAEAYSSYGPAVEDTYEYDEYAGAEKCQLLSMLAADGLDMDY